MTLSRGSGPWLLNTDAFHMAARANMTDEAPVAFLKFSMSALIFTRSREPPLQDRERDGTPTGFNDSLTNRIFYPPLV